MALILCLETATTVCSVALGKDNVCIASRELREGFSHAEKLNIFIAEIFGEVNLKFKDIDAIAVSSGPGSYTGLRIGVSSAKGFCFALDKPLISIPTLESMTYGAMQKLNPDENTLLCPMIDARRMEVYTGLFQNEKKNIESVKDVAAVIMDEGFLSGEFDDKKIIYFGDGAEKCKSVLRSDRFVFNENDFVSASNMIYLAEEKFLKNIFEDVAGFEPFYLKEFYGGKKLSA